MGCFRCYILFRLAKAISSAIVRPLMKSSFLIWWWCWCTVCYWCWSITVSISLFSHIVHSLECITIVWCPSVFEMIKGDFHCSRVLAAWEIGANEVVSLLVWSRPLLSRWLRLLMLPSSVTVFHLHNLLCKYLSLSLSLSLSISFFLFRFVCPKLYLVHLVQPFRKSVSTFDSGVGGLYVIVYRWCWSITLSVPLFSHMFHSSECIPLVWCPSVFEKWGGFPSPTRANSMRDRRKWG
jgi:hypothetical protein